MPHPFRPSVLRGAARGLRVVEGEASAAARAKALRASAARRTQPEYTLIEEGREPRTFYGHTPGVGVAVAESMAREAGERHARARGDVYVQSKGPRFSPEATARQQEKLDLMTSHADLNRDFRRAVEDDTRRRALERSNKRRGMTPEKLAAVDEQLRGIQRDLIVPDEDIERALRTGQPPRGTPRAPGTFLDAFEERYGWRPASEKEARDMLSPEALRELGFPEAP